MNSEYVRFPFMNARKILLFLISGLLMVFPLASQSVGLEKWTISGRLEPERVRQEAVVPNAAVASIGVPDYEWWYGCTPTAAGMLIGYYDINGYGGKTFRNLVPDAVAETTTFPSTEGVWDYTVQNSIASKRHVGDFYGGGYLASGDDLLGSPTGPLDSLADFMGTSQDAYENVNGATALWFFTDGSRTTVADLYGYDVYNSSGTYGIYEFLRWAGYGDINPTVVDYIYNQLVDTLGLPYGFSLSDYIAEMNAGRVVLLHIENHSMLGYGYDFMTGELLFHDTANPGENRMYWGGTYYGYRLIGVTVVNLSSVPGDEKKESSPNIGPIIQLLLSD